MGQTQVLAVAPFIVCPIISAAIYLISRRRLQDGQDSTSRAHLFYRLISYMLLGQFLGHVRWDSYATLMLLLTAAGYFMLDCGDAIGRAWNTNPHIMGAHDGAVADDIALDRGRGEDNSVLVSNNVQGPNFAQSIFALQDLQKDMRKRRWILGILLVLFALISLVEGFELIGQPDSEALVACYYIHIISLSLTAYSAMVHARLQRIEHKGRRLSIWIVLSAVVTLVIATGPIVMLASTISAQEAQVILKHPALIVMYGLAAGFLLRIQQYFHAVKQESIDKWDTLGGILVGFFTLSQAMATAVYL